MGCRSSRPEDLVRQPLEECGICVQGFGSAEGEPQLAGLRLSLKVDIRGNFGILAEPEKGKEIFAACLNIPG